MVKEIPLLEIFILNIYGNFKMVAKENKEVVSKKTYSCNTQRWKEKNEKGIIENVLCTEVVEKNQETQG